MKLDRFMRALADGEEPKTILGEIKRLETRLEQVEGNNRRFRRRYPFGPRYKFGTNAGSDCAPLRNCCLETHP